jgi:hypothetical protein
VSVTPATPNVQKGQTQQFSATVEGTNDPAQTVTWSVSGNANGGTIMSETGLLTVAAGETATTLTVTATSTADGTKSGSATVTVTEQPPTVTSVTVSPATPNVQKGQTQQFSTTVEGTNDPAQTVNWSVSSNNNNGTAINETGLLTVAAGETATTLTVTATSTADGTKFDTATVTVTSPSHGGTAVTNAAEYAAALQSGPNVTVVIDIMNDFTISSTKEISSVKSLTIYGNGHTIKQSGGAQTLRITGVGTTVAVKDLTIDGAGSKTTYDGGGSAICINGGTVTIENSVIKNCETTARDWGGAVTLGNSTGTLNLIGCSFIGNKADDYGGAVDVEGTSTKLYATNCTFYGNSSNYDGGAIYSFNAGGGEIKNCTIVGNTAEYYGGGICIAGTTTADTKMTIKNNIIVGNAADSGPDISSRGNSNITDGGRNLYGTADSKFSKVGTSTSGITSPSSWLASGAPKDNGGNGLPTIALLDVENSPAIDKLSASNAPATDQRGLVRDAQPDIGAFEFNAATPSPNPTVTGVTVSPASASVVKGDSRTFTATVAGTGAPSQVVTWSVSGNNNGGTTIGSATGLLTVASGETATTLTVTATSTYDNSKSGAATVTVMNDYRVSTAEEFSYAISKATASTPIYIEDNFVGVDNPALPGGGRKITIYGQNHTIEQADGGVTAHLDGTGNRIEIYDLTIDGADGTTTNKNGGGAIYLEGGDVYLEDVTIRDCFVTFVTENSNTNGLKYGGGAVSIALYDPPNKNVSNGSITAVNSTFTGNHIGHTYDAPGGGALSADQVYLTNCTFWNNRAADSMGGAVYARMGGSLTNCTVVNNFAGVSGGGIATRTETVNGGYTMLHLLNSIVVGNRTGGTVGKSAINVDHAYDQGGNIIGYVHTDFNADYRDVVYSNNGTRKPADGSVWNVTEGISDWLDYAEPKTNGGATPTIALKDAAASPAIDRGVTTGVVENSYTALILNAPATDQRGTSRDTKPDVGAYEFNGTLTPAVLSVNVTPNTVQVQKGNSQQFNAAVEVWADAAQTVTWSVEGGASVDTVIDGTGLLTVAAGETAATLTVKAISTANASTSGTASVTVTAPPAPPALSGTNDITSFTLAGASGTINGTTITVKVPHGRDVTALTPVIAHNGASIDKSGAQNFKSAITYTVTAENGSMKIYTVTVTAGDASEPAAPAEPAAPSEPATPSEPAAENSGWVYEDGVWYLIDAGGQMLTGWQWVDAAWYYLDSDGVMQTGWVKDGGSWYYLSGNGAMRTGWLYDGGNWYYLAGNGAMQTGWVKDDGSWYYLRENGKMVAGTWLHDTDGNWYYLSGNGKMLTGTQTIGGKTYTFKANGVWAG